jgi:hypothetical protein
LVYPSKGNRHGKGEYPLFSLVVHLPVSALNHRVLLLTGKGEMTTYFVTVKRVNKGNSSATSDPIGESFSSDSRRGRVTNPEMLPSLLGMETTIEV